jgi:hypothetical protein
MRWVGLLLALGLLRPGLALAAIGTPTQLGTASGTTTAVITTGADAPVGSLTIAVVAVGTSNIAVTSVVDSQSNCISYTALDNAPVASRPTVAIFYCATTSTDLASGQTITATVPSGDKVTITAFAVGGMASSPADVHSKQVNGASGTSATSTSTGTLAQSYELVVGGLALASTSSGFAPGGQLIAIGGLSNANASAYAAYQINCTNGTIAFAPIWTTSNAYMSDVVSFKIAAANAQCASKTNAYEILNYGTSGQQSVSKTNAYEVLSYGNAEEQSLSKTNAYIVLQTLGPPREFPHSFPP